MTSPTVHLDWQSVVDYWLGDTDAATTEAIDTHLLHCDACGEVFDAVVALGRGVRDAFARGQVPAILAPEFVERIQAAGRRVREYRLPPGGSANCSIAPEDELLVSRVSAPLEGVERLDAVFTYSHVPDHEDRLRDLPFHADAGEVLFAHQVAMVRRQPSHDVSLRLVAVDAAGEREIARYTFHHRAASDAG